MNDLYIALIPARLVCAREDWSTGLAVYYDPGSISMKSRLTLSYCFLERLPHSGDLTVRSGFHARLSDERVDDARSLLDQERRRVDANLPDDWPAGIHPEMHHWAKRLYRLHYFEPDHGFVSGLLGQVKAGRTLSEKQTAVIDEMYRERGGVQGLRSRHRIQWRLRKLARLEMKSDDHRTLKTFSHYAQTSQGLRESKKPVISAIEYDYWRQRLSQTEWRAERIAAQLDDDLTYRRTS